MILNGTSDLYTVKYTSTFSIIYLKIRHMNQTRIQNFFHKGLNYFGSFSKKKKLNLWINSWNYTEMSINCTWNLKKMMSKKQKSSRYRRWKLVHRPFGSYTEKCIVIILYFKIKTNLCIWNRFQAKLCVILFSDLY